MTCAASLLLIGETEATQQSLEHEAARASCLVEANSVIKLSSATQGTLSQVNFKRGAAVKVGQIVAQLESEVELAQYDCCQAEGRVRCRYQGKTC
jgi:multidrug efflux pump subunit AcrA (membrane-fusion protein)